MKVVINREWGGFSVSEVVYRELGLKWEKYGFIDNEELGIKDDNLLAYRTNPRLIAAIEKIGVVKASGELASLKIVTIPDDVDWHLANNDGIETIHENRRQWP